MSLRPLQRPPETRVVERLHQIIERPSLERAQRIFIHSRFNGVKLPAWFHQGAGNFLHSEETAKIVYQRLKKASKRGVDAFLKELDDIGAEIKKAVKKTRVCNDITNTCDYQ